MRALFAGFVMVLVMNYSLAAKGTTSKITIHGVNLTTPLDITDDTTLKDFQVWSGPGVFHGAAEITTEETEGFIIDWRSGVVAQPPSGLQRYEVSFYVTDNRFPGETRPEHLAYVVLYQYDPTTAQGYVYLPGRGDQWFELNASAIHHGHGFEGHWFRATRRWQDVVGPLIARALQ